MRITFGFGQLLLCATEAGATSFFKRNILAAQKVDQPNVCKVTSNTLDDAQCAVDQVASFVGVDLVDATRWKDRQVLCRGCTGAFKAWWHLGLQIPQGLNAERCFRDVNISAATQCALVDDDKAGVHQCAGLLKRGFRHLHDGRADIIKELAEFGRLAILPEERSFAHDRDKATIGGKHGISTTNLTNVLPATSRAALERRVHQDCFIGLLVIDRTAHPIFSVFLKGAVDDMAALAGHVLLQRFHIVWTRLDCDCNRSARNKPKQVSSAS